MTALISLFKSQAATVHDLQLKRTRDYKLVWQLNRQWHSVLPVAPAGAVFAFLIYDRRTLAPVGVAIIGHPTARMEDHDSTLELTRMALSSAAPRNTGSWALARIRRYIRKHRPEITRMISYQDAAVHDGALYKADNWHKVYEKRGESTWTNRDNRRPATERQHKIKWERRLA